MALFLGATVTTDGSETTKLKRVNKLIIIDHNNVSPYFVSVSHLYLHPSSLSHGIPSLRISWNFAYAMMCCGI
jgi:hypothetical protein